MNRQIFQGDVIEQLAKFPDCSVDCIISSPPYWGLRDYSVEGQLGLEPDFHDYLNKMQTIMDGLKRVLKNTGTCWINLGDTYGGSGKGAGTDLKTTKRVWEFKKRPKMNETITAKSRIGIPERFYINCIDGGWIARNHIVWTKNNCMPSSVKDRFTNKWESVFFFSKNKKYYFDLDAVREPTITGTKPFNARVRDSKKQRYLQKATDEEIKNHNGKGEKKWDYKTMANGLDEHSGNSTNHSKGKNPGDVFQINNVKGEFKGKASKEFLLKWQKNEDSIHGNNAYNPKGKNPGDVFKNESPKFEQRDNNKIDSAGGRKHYWSSQRVHDINQKHFAKFLKQYTKDNQEELNKIFTESTWKHWIRTDDSGSSLPSPEQYTILKRILNLPDEWDICMTETNMVLIDDSTHEKGKNPGDVFRINTKPFKEAHFATFPPDLPQKILKCACPKDGIVLDPFFGSGTVGLVAEQMGLQWCGIELNPEYIEIAKKRLDPYTSMQKMEAFV